VLASQIFSNLLHVRLDLTNVNILELLEQEFFCNPDASFVTQV